MTAYIPWVLVFLTIIQLLYWLLVFSRLAFHKKTTPAPQKIENKVSIVICAKDEAENLKKFLPRILNQSYRILEIIVVDDHSCDTTANTLRQFKKKYNNLHIVRTDKDADSFGKKYALAKGINAAKNDVLLLTDADCQPNSLNWTTKMQQYITGNIEIGLGYAPYFTYPGFLNKFIRFETVYTAIQYFSFTLVGMPYMGVGRNLIYKKSLFNEAGGFSEHMNIKSGDDDLFINQVANKSNTSIILDKDTFVYSVPKKSFSAYYKQKSRHLTTGTKYTLIQKLILGLLSFSHFFFYFFLTLSLILQISIIFAVTLYVIRMGLILLIIKPILKTLEEKSLLVWIPILDFAFVFFYIIFLPNLFFRKKTTWK